jgi:glycosyltransferase involved in cell wall biosynthesis
VANLSTSGNQTQQAISVTALLPVKNGMKYILTAKEQLSRTCRKFDEIIVIDDESTDGTLPELKRWELEDSRVRVISNSGQGLVSALNLGLQEASNNWVARFDVDDKYTQNRIDQQVAVVDSETIAIFSDYEICRPNGDSLGKIPSPVDSDAVKISLVNSRRTAHPSVLFSREAVLSVGGYRAEDFPAEDLSLWLRMSRVGKLVSVPQLLLKYQLGTSSVSGQHRSLIVKRTSELLQQIGVEDAAIKSGFQRVDEILDIYSELNLGKERQLLFLMELSRVLKISDKPLRGAALSMLIKKVDLNILSATLNLSIDTAKRRLHRKLS